MFALRTPLVTATCLGLLSVAGTSQTPSEAVILVGGPGSCSSEGTCDPGLLNDGVTEASARILFTLDATGRLALEVTNTSPVLAGTPNPTLTRVYFSAPPEVTGMALVDQSAPAGNQPSFGFGFGTNAFSAGAFGAFDALLSDGVQGGIANADADTVAVSTAVRGPVTFLFDVQGDLGAVTASSFASALSVLPSGQTPSQAAVKFQGGGEAEASSFMNQGLFCDTVASEKNLGGGCGATLTCTSPMMGQSCTIRIEGNSPGSRVLVMASQPAAQPLSFQGCEVYLTPRNRMMVRIADTDDEGNLVFEVPAPTYADSPGCCGVSFVVQAVVLSDSGPLPIGEMTNAVEITLGS